MSLEYTINYHAVNDYEKEVSEAFWQFLIIPEENDSQELLQYDFSSSLNEGCHESINGLGFKALQVHSKRTFQRISFEFRCSVVKKEVNPFNFVPNLNVKDDYITIGKHSFKTKNEPYLRKTALTKLPEKYISLCVFDKSKSVFENLQELNHWVYGHLYFKVNVTDVDTSLEEIIEKRQGVCQDFTHLFCAIARENDVPTRYVSGYLHQGNGFFGDSQMHAWAEAYVPNGGWIGFDPTNDILVGQNHIKVAHGKDYNDCAPLKGIVRTTGKNETTYTVQVQASQQQ